MFNIRNNVFETNSSSMHSVVMSKNNEGHFDEEEIRESFNLWLYKNKRKDIVSFKCEDLEFGRWPFDVLYSYCDKLRYFLAWKNWSDEELKEFKDFIFNRHKIKLSFQKEDDIGYVDGQSRGVLPSFFNKNDLDINEFEDVEEFLSNKKYVILIDGDEYCLSISLANSGLIDCPDLRDDDYTED